MKHNKTIKIEAYLFYPNPVKIKDFAAFFDHPQELNQHITNCLVFLNKQSALQYGRFLQEDRIVLKAYVPHTAIQGRSHGLTIKKDIISSTHIHGCFPNLAKSNLYFENPHFDERHYPSIVSVNEEELIDLATI